MAVVSVTFENSDRVLIAAEDHLVLSHDGSEAQGAGQLRPGMKIISPDGEILTVYTVDRSDGTDVDLHEPTAEIER